MLRQVSAEELVDGIQPLGSNGMQQARVCTSLVLLRQLKGPATGQDLC